MLYRVIFHDNETADLSEWGDGEKIVRWLAEGFACGPYRLTGAWLDDDEPDPRERALHVEVQGPPDSRDVLLEMGEMLAHGYAPHDVLVDEPLADIRSTGWLDARRMALPGEEARVRLFTTAPEAADGFGTRTVREVGRMRWGVTTETVREVEVDPDHLEWQRGRYRSGLWMASTPEQFEDLFADRVSAVDA